MKTATLSNGTQVHLSEISLKACLEAIKKDFRKMPYKEAYAANKDDIDYIVRKGYKSRTLIMRSLHMTVEFAGTLNA